MVRDLWSDVLRSNDEGIGMTVGLELSHPARQCDDKPTESVGSKLARLWGLNLWGETSDDLGTLTLKKKNNEMYQSKKEYERLENYKNKRKKSVWFHSQNQRDLKGKMTCLLSINYIKQ